MLSRISWVASCGASHWGSGRTARTSAAPRPYDKALVARIREDAGAGRLREGLDADGVVSLMFGAYLGELVRRGRVSPGWLDRSMEMLWSVMVSTDDIQQGEDAPT